jgi:hypothetical protein
LPRSDKSGGLLDRGESSPTSEADKIEEGEGGRETQALSEVTGEPWAEVTGAGGDEESVDVGKLKSRFLESLSGCGLGKCGGVLLKAGHHFVGFEDKGILHLFEAKMAGFDAIPILKNFTK